MNGDRRVKLGVVGVDSGQLLLIDPGNLDEHWRRPTPTRLRFWGRDAGRLRKHLEQSPLTDRIEDVGDGVFVMHPKAPNVSDEVDPRPVTAAGLRWVARGVEQEVQAHELRVVWELEDPAASFEAVRALTEGEAHGGQLNYATGRPGLGVALRAGLGDGLYEVWVDLRDLGPLGERVARIEVVLIRDKPGSRS